MDAKDLFAFYEEARELREKLARVEAVIRQLENEQWRKHQAERDAFIRAEDDRQALRTLRRLRHVGA